MWSDLYLSCIAERPRCRQGANATAFPQVACSLLTTGWKLSPLRGAETAAAATVAAATGFLLTALSQVPFIGL